MTQHHRFNPVGTGRHDIDGRLHQLFQAFDVPASVFGQLFQRTGSHGGFLQTRAFFVDRVDLFPTFRLVGGTQAVPVRILITDADFDGVQTIEYVQLSQTDASDAIDQVRVAHRGNIKPATATLTPGGSAKLMASLTQVLADLTAEPSGEWGRATARGISLGNA